MSPPPGAPAVRRGGLANTAAEWRVIRPSRTPSCDQGDGRSRSGAAKARPTSAAAWKRAVAAVCRSGERGRHRGRLVAAGAPARGRPGDERLADLPVVAERVLDPPQAPAVLLGG